MMRSLPKVMFRPESARTTKQVAVIQCTRRSNMLKRTSVRHDRPDSSLTIPRITIVPSQYSVTSWKRRQSRPAGCSILYDLTSGMLPRPLMMRISCNSCCSFTELAVGLTEVSELRCCAPAGGANATHARTRHRRMQDREAEAPPANRMRERNLVVMFVPSPTLLRERGRGEAAPRREIEAVVPRRSLRTQ